MAPPTMHINSFYRPPRRSSSDDALVSVYSRLCLGEFACCGVRHKHVRHDAAALKATSEEASCAIVDLSTAGSAPGIADVLSAGRHDRSRSISGSASGSKDDRKHLARLQIQRELTTFFRSDPRRAICDFFRPGDSRGPLGYLQAKGLTRRSRDLEPHDSHFFGIFRPTNMEALNMMMMGTATGKALNIKGKSAKRGVLRGFVPFLQISEAADKKRVRTGERSGRVRVFYRSVEARAQALGVLRPVLLQMISVSRTAEAMLASFESQATELSADEREAACHAMRWSMVPPPRTVAEASESARESAMKSLGFGGEDFAEEAAELLRLIDDGAGTVGIELPVIAVDCHRVPLSTIDDHLIVSASSCLRLPLIDVEHGR